MQVLAFLVLIAAVAAREPTGILAGFQVLSVTAVTPLQFTFLKGLVENVELDFWTPPKYQGITDIMVSPDQKELLVTLLATKGIEWSVKISDVGRIVDEQRLENDKLRGEGRMTWAAYNSYAEIVQWLESIESNDLVTLTPIGQSFEGRDIHQVKISSGGPAKLAIFIDANSHAREWVTSAVATWIINEIISNPDNYADILSDFDFFFVPMVNPDGYEYSHGAGNRMWKKTRSTNSGSPDCNGTDLNRNFDFHFDEVGTSGDPCSDIYPGVAAFSETEAEALRDAIEAIPVPGVYAYYTLHSYGQLLLLPWAWTQAEQPTNYNDTLKWGKASAAAIGNVHQKSYRAGQSADMLYAVGGTSDDWAKNKGIEYVATLEVRDIGQYGYLLPADQIIPTAEEIWAGIQVIATT